MGTKIETGNYVEAEKWVKGKIVVGFFIGADLPPKCDSRKLTFKLTSEDSVACWETATLARQVAQMQAGGYYRIVCNGKSVQTKNGDAWGFDVEKADSEAEVKKWEQEYRAYVAGGGK
jgi:hypothetical protein